MDLKRPTSRLSFALLAAAMFAAGAHAQPSLDELHKACHDYASDLPNRSAVLKAERFGPCDAYASAAQQQGSAPHQVLAGIHMEALNNALLQFDGKGALPMVAGQQVPPDVYSRRVRYLWDAITPAEKLGADNAWMVPELVTLLGSAKGFDFNQSGKIIANAYRAMTADGLREGAEWAALTTAAAGYTSGRGGMGLDRDALLKDLPAATAQLDALPDSDYSRERLYRARLGRAELLRKSDPVAAFDELLSAHAMAMAQVPNEVDFVQLLMANALRDHAAVLVPARRDEISNVIEQSPNAKYKDRILNALAATTTDCKQVQHLFDQGQQFNGGPDSTPAAELLLATLYGMKDKADELVMRLLCLDDARLRKADSDGHLAEQLLVAYPPGKRDNGTVSKAVAELEGRLKR